MNYTPGQRYALTYARAVLAADGDAEHTPSDDATQRLLLGIALIGLIAAFEDDCDPPAWAVQAAKCNPADTMDRLRWVTP